MEILDDIAPLVEEVLGRGCWLDRDLGWVACPGAARHTTNHSPNDCKVFPNGARPPRLSCFHQRCVAEVASANTKLASAYFRIKEDDRVNRRQPTKEQKQTAMEHAVWTSRAGSVKQRILRENAWPVEEMMQRSPVAIGTDPCPHWKQLIGLFGEDDVIWAGSLYDSGDAAHARNFRVKGDWLKDDVVPGQYICPATFKSGVWSRSKLNVENRRYLVVESDVLSKNEVASVFRWLQHLAGLHLVAVVDTGGRSLHGWFQMPNPELLAKLEIVLPALGCDRAMFAPSQPCRLPGALRDGTYQRLLYLDQPAENLTCDIETFLPLPWFFYDGIGKAWYLPDKSGRWISGCQRDAERHLLAAGYGKEYSRLGYATDLELTLNQIQDTQNIDYAAPLAGYKAGPYHILGHRILVTTSPSLYTPMAGEFPTLLRFFAAMLPQPQLDYFFGWLSQTFKMLYGDSWLAGQAIAFAGPRKSGKSFIQTILTEMFGGREEDPFKYLSDRTTFNGNLLTAEHLRMEDKSESVKISDRRHLGSLIKQIASCETVNCERKHSDALTLTPRQRISFTLNLGERMLILPPIEHDIEDKLMLLKVEPFPVPGPPAEKTAFRLRLFSELPMFIHYLLNWTIEEHMSDSRMGVKFYHQPQLLREINSHAPETQLLDIIDENIFDLSRSDPWHGRARDLFAELTDPKESCSKEANNLLNSAVTCGKYLARLAEKYPERVESTTHGNYGSWTIYSVFGKTAYLATPRPTPSMRLANRLRDAANEKVGGSGG